MFNVMANAMVFGLVGTSLTQEKEAGETLQERIPLKRPATVQQAVGPPVFMLSEEASSIMGQVIEVDGGYQM